MAAEFAGRVALVTGVSRPGQIGHALARALGEAGARLVVCDRSHELLEDRRREFESGGLEVAASAGDLTDPRAAGAAVALAVSRFDGLDIVVNVAGGLTSYGPFLETDVSALERELTINLRTAFCVCQAAVPALRRRGGGAIVNFASIAVLHPAPNLAAYSAAKGSVAAFTRALARELFDDAIRVNAVAPAAVRTASNVHDMGEDAELVEMEDLVRSVLFLVSPASGTLTGHLLPVMPKGR